MNSELKGNNQIKAKKPKKKMPAWLSITLLFLSLCILVYGFFFFDKKIDVEDLPAGWDIINPPGDVHSMAVMGDTLWAGGKKGIYIIDRIEKKLLEELNPEKPIRYVKALLVDNNKTLWIGHANGLTSYKDGIFKTYTESDGLPDKRVNTIIQAKDGCIWAGTWKGAICFNDQHIELLNSESGLIDDMVNIMYEDSHGNIWFGSYTAPRGGISIWKDGKSRTFNKESGLPHNNITSIAEDRSGNIWVGTGLYKRGGASRFHYDGKAWNIDSTIIYKDGLAGEKVRSIFIDTHSNMWLGSEYDGLAIFHKNCILIIDEDNGLSHPEIKCILQDKDDFYWLGTNDGLNCLSVPVIDSLIFYQCKN